MRCIMFESDNKIESFLRRLVELVEKINENNEKLLSEQKRVIKILSKLDVKEE